MGSSMFSYLCNFIFYPILVLGKLTFGLVRREDVKPLSRSRTNVLRNVSCHFLNLSSGQSRGYRWEVRESRSEGRWNYNDFLQFDPGRVPGT